ncbi:MAG: multicopper oxidase domain-containing protein [Flavobacteriaceae bacterium]|nr:multicopper oxidase domain-containing protein [Flavobacteriaceae bacterium]
MKKITTLLFLIIVFQLNAQNPIIIPGTLSGTDINLTLQNGTHQFYNGINTTTMGVNGNILGPTIILDKGDFVNFSVENLIGETTTIHWHGLHVAPENDGGPHTTILPGETWTPSFTILDKAATYWYHPHLHEKTNEHVSKGIAGMIIVKDNEEAALTLPRTYGEDDFPIVIQTKDFDVNNEIVVPSNSDDIIMVNATIDPQLDIPAQVVRLRLLNGSSMRTFNMGLNANQSFYQIASDGGLLNESVLLTRLRMAPGERAEILIDLTGMQGQTLQLMSYASEFQNGIYGATNPGMGAGMVLNGYNPNPLNGADFTILQLDVVSPIGNPVTTIPNALVTVTPILEGTEDITRNLVMTSVNGGPQQLNGDFVINGVPFNMNVVNYEIPLGNTEIWRITNSSAIAHPFHIHDVQFYILDREGVPPAPSEQGLKDVIYVLPQETVRFITKFEDFANPDVPYMYHCHMLYHEDRGMMGQFTVVDNLGIGDLNLDQGVAIYPNPSKGVVNLKTSEGVIVSKIEIYNVLGSFIKSIEISNNQDSIDANELSEGMYLLKIVSNQGEVTKKLIIN